MIRLAHSRSSKTRFTSQGLILRACETVGRAVRRTLVPAACAVALVASAPASAYQPTFTTSQVDETVYFPRTSAICGFPVFERDTGTVTVAFTTLPDGSARAHDIAVRITITIYSTDPAHPGTVTTVGVGGRVQIEHPDGSISILTHGQDGHATLPGEGIVWATSGMNRIEIDANGNVTEIQHNGNFSPDRSGLCALL
jgi:hypothetical protein